MLKKQQKMIWRYGREGGTHKIWPGPMQRFLRNLSLRTMDDGRLCHDSSQAELKTGLKIDAYNAIIR